MQQDYEIYEYECSKCRKKHYVRGEELKRISFERIRSLNNHDVFAGCPVNPDEVSIWYNISEFKQVKRINPNILIVQLDPEGSYN